MRTFWVTRHALTEESFRIVELGASAKDVRHHVLPNRAAAEAFLVRRGAREVNARKALTEAVSGARAVVEVVEPIN